MNVLTIGAHPDDLEIGMGGVINKYVKQGHNVLMLVVTLPKESRREECEAAADILGAELKLLGVPQEELSYGRGLVKTFDEVIQDFSPSEVFTHWNHDSHQEHNFVTSAVLAAGRKNTFSLYLYEQTLPAGITSEGFNPQLFIEIEDEVDAKLSSLRAHQSQYVHNKEEQWIDSIRGRSKYRGYQINVGHAEAFEVIKEIRL